MNIILFPLGIMAILLTLKTGLGFLALEKRCLLFYMGLPLYIVTGIILGLFAQNLSFNKLISLLLEKNTLTSLGGIQIIIAGLMILFGLGKIKKNNLIDRYKKWFAAAVIIPCPFTIVFFLIFISFFQFKIQGVSSLGISIGCTIFYCLWLILFIGAIKRFVAFKNRVDKVFILLGSLFIAIVIFAPILLSQEQVNFTSFISIKEMLIPLIGLLLLVLAGFLYQKIIVFKERKICKRNLVNK